MNFLAHYRRVFRKGEAQLYRAPAYLNNGDLDLVVDHHRVANLARQIKHFSLSYRVARPTVARIAKSREPLRIFKKSSHARAQVGRDGRLQIGFDGTGLPTDAMTVTLAREGERVSVSIDMAGKVMVDG